MKKTIFAIISAMLFSTQIIPASANEQKVIAIIDSELDASKFSNIIHEVCIVSDKTCNNASNFQEGPGSANIPNWKIRNTGHGHSVVYTSNQINNNIKIVFIRVAGTRHNASSIQLPSIEIASKWVTDNYAKYSIDAVSISLSTVAPGCRTSKVFDQSVESLAGLNIPVFAGVGNRGNSSAIGWPACAPGVYSVGSLLGDEKIAFVSSGGASAKIMSRICLSFRSPVHCNSVPDFFGVMRQTQGSSISSPIAAVTLLSKWNGELWSELIASMPSKDGYAIVR
jgi:hypothetical protein